MATNEFLIIGACNVIFIFITIILIFVPIDESKDFSSTELIAILSMLWCFINSFLAFRFLKSEPTDSNTSNLNKDYLKSGDHSLHTNINACGAYKPNRNSDENVQILIKDNDDGDKLHTKTDDVVIENGEIELENIKIKLIEEQDKFSDENTKRRELEYENKQILDEYKRYKQENNETSKDNLMLIENCKQLTQQNEALQQSIKEKEEENESSQQKMSEMEEEIDSMKQRIESMQTEIAETEEMASELNAFRANSEIAKKQIAEYEERIAELQEKEALLTEENVQLTQSIDLLKEQHAKEMEENINSDAAAVVALNNESIEKLKKELAHAQKTIIEMTSVVGVQQKFPTVQETIQQFRSIRDQKHHDASTLLKKFIKTKCAAKWQKYFINQTVHEIMFDILIECYRYNESYRAQIYDEIGDILNMKYAIAAAYEIDTNEMENNRVIEAQQMKILSNIFGSYFKTNFKYVLEKRLVSNEKEDDDEKEKKNGSKNSDLVQQILQFVQQKHSEYVSDATEEVINGLKEYIIECCHVCWVMILQDPPLNIKPSQWLQNETAMLYDEAHHKRVLGSDRKCKKILYYVWPAVARNDVILGDQKIDVILRENLYPRLKEKKKA